MKIVTLTLNPALDKSSNVERLVPEQKLRCAPLQFDAGGGGINVSKGIRKLGGHSTAVFPAGGATGQHLQSILENAGVEIRAHTVPGETRENFSVTETSTNIQYRFNMPGVELSEKQADALLDIVAQLQPGYLVASGSLPPGLPETYYEKVAAFAKKDRGPAYPRHLWRGLASRSRRGALSAETQPRRTQRISRCRETGDEPSG